MRGFDRSLRIREPINSVAPANTAECRTAVSLHVMARPSTEPLDRSESGNHSDKPYLHWVLLARILALE